MGLVAETLVVLVRSESWIYAIVVRCRIAVIGRETVLRVRRVVLQHRCEPECRHAQFLEVVQVLPDTVQVAAMPEARLRAVLHVGSHPWNLLGVVGALGEAVGHQHIEHVGVGESQSLLALLLARLQLELFTVHLSLFTSEVQRHRSRLRILQIHVDEQIVGRVETHQTVDLHAGIVRRHVLHVADTLSVDHQLHRGVLHPYEPVCGLNSVNHTFLCCTHCHYVCHQDGG